MTSGEGTQRGYGGMKNVNRRRRIIRNSAMSVSWGRLDTIISQMGVRWGRLDAIISLTIMVMPIK
jgi:hypothetical protein